MRVSIAYFGGLGLAVPARRKFQNFGGYLRANLGLFEGVFAKDHRGRWEALEPAVLERAYSLGIGLCSLLSERSKCERSNFVVSDNASSRHAELKAQLLGASNRIAALEKKLNRLTDPSLSGLKSFQELFDGRRSYAPVCGIYCLFSGVDLVYVGQSVNVHSRISQHALYTDKKFDSFSYIPCNRDELNMMEARYILRFRPVHNFSSRGQLVLPIAPECIEEEKVSVTGDAK